MIYRLEMENFRCFRERQVIDLSIPPNVADDPERFAPIFAGSSHRVPKVVTLYGANGSGKSTVLRALNLLFFFIRDSFGQATPIERFNDEESANRPIRLAIELGGIQEFSEALVARAQEDRTVPRGTLRYELEFAVEEGIVKHVGHEALRRRPNGKGKWIRVFERATPNRISGSKTFPLSGYKQVIDKIPIHSSVIATLAHFGHEPSRILVQLAQKVISNILVEKTDVSDRDLAKILIAYPQAVERLKEELPRIDVGVKQMEIRQTNEGPQLFFEHEGLLDRMHWNLQSHGTQSFIRIFPHLLFPLSIGGVAIIDELDVSIHPQILREIVRWFHNPERNPYDAQLWATTHAMPLMDDLTKESIVLCEKNRQGWCQVYSLMDVQSVRRTDNLYKKYLGGVYGAVPYIG